MYICTYVCSFPHALSGSSCGSGARSPQLRSAAYAAPSAVNVGTPRNAAPTAPVRKFSSQQTPQADTHSHTTHGNIQHTDQHNRP